LPACHGVAMEPIVQCIGLTKRYRKLVAVNGLDLTVTRGEVFGFLGPNGAGKSTTIRLLLGLIQPTAGEALLFGEPVRTGRSRILRRVGALVEEPAFYDYLSGRKNLEMLAAMSGGCPRARIDEVLGLVGLTDRQHDRVHAYSHGMKQRLGLAQALLPHPDLVILDEPATGLDPAGLIEIRNLLRRLAANEGMTIFLSSHLLAEVEIICTDVGLVSRGRLVARGKVADLLARGEQQATVQVDDPARAAAALGELPYVTQAEAADGLLTIHVAADRLADVNHCLVQAGLRVSALIPQRERLEELYMAIMAETADADAAAR